MNKITNNVGHTSFLQQTNDTKEKGERYQRFLDLDKLMNLHYVNDFKSSYRIILKDLLAHKSCQIII